MKYQNKLIRDILKDGYTIKKNFLSQKEIDFYLSKIQKIYSKKKNIFKGLPKRDKKDKIIYNLQNKDLNFVKLLNSPDIFRVCKYFLQDKYFRLLPPNRPNFILSYYNARSSGSKLDLHIDSHIPYLGNHVYMLQVAIILENQNEKNGCTVLKPKSHLSGKYTNRKETNLKKINSKAGDLVIWDSRIWHGTTKNTSRKTRWALIATFSCWWLKQSMDMVRSLPKNIFKRLSINEKIILGYCATIPIDENDLLRTKKKISEIKF
jgi:hypothetical protein